MRIEAFVAFLTFLVSLAVAAVIVSIFVSIMHLLWQALFWLAIIGLGCVIYFMFSVWVRMRR